MATNWEVVFVLYSRRMKQKKNSAPAYYSSITYLREKRHQAAGRSNGLQLQKFKKGVAAVNKKIIYEHEILQYYCMSAAVP